MKLVRLAVISLSPVPRIKPGETALQVGGVTPSVAPVKSPETRTFHLTAKAFIKLPSLEVDEAGFATIPAGPREECEGAIVTIADLLAVTGRCRRTILTATPPLALVPENAIDRATLRDLRCIRADAAHPIPYVYSHIDLKDVVAGLSDRLIGAALIAEAYAHTTMSGRFREFVRVFELAFSQDLMQMAKKLTQTLHPTFGYTQDEIRTWQALRHPLTHADGKLTKMLAFESDAREVIQRMEQAALDVLFNKAQWGEWSSARRDAWMPTAITVNAAGQGVVRSGSSNVSSTILLLDEFRAFPRSLEMQHTGLPEDWFSRFVPVADTGTNIGSREEF